MNALSILTSRRFWLLVLDSAGSIVLHFYGGPDVSFLIGALQPVFIALIIAFTIDDTTAARIEAGK